MDSTILFLIKTSNLPRFKRKELLVLLDKLWDEPSDTNLELVIDEILNLVGDKPK